MKLFHEDALLELVLDPHPAPTPPSPDECVLWLQGHLTGYRSVRYTSGMELQSWVDAFRTRFTNLEAAGGLVQDSQGRILTMFRRGAWDLPKGKLDPGETPEKAAIREVKEETGLNRLKIVERLPATYHIYRTPKHNPALDGWHFKTTHWYRMQGDASERLVPQTDEDIETIEWTAPAIALSTDRPTWASVKTILQLTASTC